MARRRRHSKVAARRHRFRGANSRECSGQIDEPRPKPGEFLDELLAHTLLGLTTGDRVLGLVDQRSNDGDLSPRRTCEVGQHGPSESNSGAAR
jgi:hypothetical protein